jgi:hypothetical protein
MKQAFAEARATNALRLVILTQANPRVENSWRESVRRNYFKPAAPPLFSILTGRCVGFFSIGLLLRAT